MKVKKILLTLGSILVCGICIANGQYIAGPREGKNDIGERTLNIKENTYDENIEKNIELKTAIISNQLTDYKNVFGIYNNPFIIFYRNTEGILSYYWGGTRNIGGKIKNYTICDYKENTLENYTNCTNTEYTGENIEILNNMLAKTKATDNYYYGNAQKNGQQANMMIPYLTINIGEINKSIIFLLDIYHGNGQDNNLGIPNIGSGTYTIDYNGNYTYENFPTEKIGNTPIVNNGGNTENNKFCPMVKFQIDMYGSRFNTELCYSNNQTVSGNQVIEETPITMLEAFPTYQDYRQAYDLFTNYCHTEYQNTQEECQTALQSIGKKPAQIIRKTIKNNQDNTILKTERIYQYCYLNLTYTGDAQRNTKRCELTDEQKYAPGLDSSGSPNPLEGYEDMLLNSETEIELPPEGTVFDEILPDGIISWNNLFTNFNFFSSLTELIGKIFILFKLRPTVEGILPPVIMSLLLLIILFRIFKK